MKKIGLSVVCMLLVLCLLPVGVSAASGKVVRITHYQKVNVRSGPGSGYTYLGEVSPDEVFEYLGSENGWNCIQYTSSKIGYVSGNLSTVEYGSVEAVSGATESADSTYDNMTGDSYVQITHYQKVNVRYGPGSSYGYICEVSPHEVYPYMGTLNGWYCIEMHDGKLGYVYGEYATLSGRSYEAEGIVCAACGGDGLCPYCDDGEVYNRLKKKWDTCLECYGSDICLECYSTGYDMF